MPGLKNLIDGHPFLILFGTRGMDGDFTEENREAGHAQRTLQGEAFLVSREGKTLCGMIPERRTEEADVFFANRQALRWLPGAPRNFRREQPERPVRR